MLSLLVSDSLKFSSLDIQLLGFYGCISYSGWGVDHCSLDLVCMNLALTVVSLGSVFWCIWRLVIKIVWLS